MSFTDGKPRAATVEDLTLRWMGSAKNFRCRLCGYVFRVGDIWRFVFANFDASPSHYGNFLVCQSCDGETVLEKAAQQEQEYQTRFWWFRRGEK